MRFYRVFDDIFQLQDEITHDVIAALNIKLVANEIDRIWFSKLTSPGAIESYYRGASHFYELNKEDNAVAREMFERLYEVQPDSVVGPSYIAVTHWMDAFFKWSDAPVRSCGFVYGHLVLLEGKYDEALATCTDGTKLRTSCPLAHGLLGLVLNFCGDPEAAVDSVKEALRLEKVYPT